MNSEAKVLYYKNLYLNLSEDIQFLKTLLEKMDDERLENEQIKIRNLLNAYIEEKNNVSVILAQLDIEIEEESNQKEVYEKYFMNKNIYPLCLYVYQHYYDDLLKIRDTLSEINKQTNVINNTFVRLTPIERMSLYQINMDYFDSK